MCIINGFIHLSPHPSESAQSGPSWADSYWCLGRSGVSFRTEGPTHSLSCFTWTEDNKYFCSMSFANNGAPNCQVVFHFEAVWYLQTSWHKPQAIPNWTASKKKRQDSTSLSMRLTNSKCDPRQHWQPYFSCAIVFIKCLSYQCLISFFVDTWVTANVTKPNCYYFDRQPTLLYLIAGSLGLSIQSKPFFNNILAISKKWISFCRVAVLIAVRDFPAKARQRSDTPFLSVE